MLDTNNKEQITERIDNIRTKRLIEFDSKPSNSRGRLQVYCGTETEDLVKRLAILIGCKRAEIVQLALKEFAEKIDPNLLG